MKSQYLQKKEQDTKKIYGKVYIETIKKEDNKMWKQVVNDYEANDFQCCIITEEKRIIIYVVQKILTLNDKQKA